MILFFYEGVRQHSFFISSKKHHYIIDFYLFYALTALFYFNRKLFFITCFLGRL